MGSHPDDAGHVDEARLWEYRRLAGADSLGYLSLQALEHLAPDAKCGFCKGCFTGTYPIPVDEAEK